MVVTAGRYEVIVGVTVSVVAESGNGGSNSGCSGSKT